MSPRILLVALPLLGLALDTAAQGKLRRHRSDGGPVPQIAPVVLDFQTEDDFVTPLVNGQSVASPEQFGALVSISGSGPNLGPAVFDSSPGGPNDPSQDVDLLVGSGNVLLLQNSDAPGQSVPGVFDRPNDDEDGGELIFDFDLSVELLSVVLVDIDGGSEQASSVTLTDEQGRTRVYTVPPRWTTDLVQEGPPGRGTLDLTTLAPQPGHLATATAAEQPGFDAEHVRQLVVALGSSGAVDDLSWSPGRSLGMVADDATRTVTVFDADLDVVLGSVQLNAGSFVGDCAIDPSRKLGFVTNFLNRVWVIDLASSPPVLAGGVNPIVISNPGEDLSLSPDRRFLAVSDGNFVRPLSIVDLETRLEVGTVSTGGSCNSVDFCDQDTLVGTSYSLDRIVRFSLASDGTPSLMSGFLALREPNNVTCAPGGLTAVAVSGAPAAKLRSFEVDGMVAVTTRGIDYGLSACFSNDGRRLFVRQNLSFEAWSFDPFTGALGESPLYSVEADHVEEFFGMERIALHPDGSRLYVPVWDGVRIHDPLDGSVLATLPIPLVSPGGIAIARGL